MLRITVDTNTLISAVIAKCNEFELLKAAKLGKIKIIVSHDILKEFLGVISRPKFGLSKKQIENVFKQILSITEIIIPDTKVSIIKEDPSDNMILECAEAAEVDYIISGDSHLLRLKKYKKIPIVRTFDILEMIKSLEMIKR